MKFEKTSSRIRKLDLDMIWDHDRYVKASPGSALQSSNNGLTISDDLGRKSGIFSASNEIRFKKRFWDFFEKYRKSMSRSKISSWNHSESKEHTRNIFPSYSYEGRISKSEKSFMHILLAFLKNDSAHWRRWTIIFSISWFDDFLVYDVIPRGRYNWKWILVTQMRINVFFQFWIGSKILQKSWASVWRDEMV